MTSPTPAAPSNNNTSTAAENTREAVARPGIVTAAAVLGLIWGGLTILSSLVSMVAGSILRSAGTACAPNDQSGLCAFVTDSSSLLIVIGSALIAAAALVVVGSIVALNGKSAKVLVIASAIQVAIQIAWMIETGSVAFGIVGVLVPILIIGLILNSGSRRWFNRSRAATR